MKVPLLLICFGLLAYGATISAGLADVHAQSKNLQTLSLLPTPTATQSSPPSTALTTTIPATLDSLQIVYRRDQQLWRWQQGVARPILELTEVGNFSLSPDGKWLAFERDNDLWLARTDGTDERLLVDHTALEPLAPDEPLGRIQLAQWLPDSQQLLFHFSAAETNFSLGSRLYVMDVEQGQWSELLMLGWSTTVLPAPDSATLALISQAEIRIMDVDSQNLYTIFSYTPGAFTHLESPQVRWSADSHSLVTVEVAAPDHLRVWQLSVVAGTEPTLLVEVEPQIAAPYNYSLSPTGHYLVYASIGIPDMAIPPGKTYFVDLQTGKEWLYYAGVGSFGAWLPQSDRFSFWVNHEDNLYLGSAQNSLLSPLRQSYPHSLVWMDEENFLYRVGDHELRLGTLGPTDVVIDDQAEGFTFAR